MSESPHEEVMWIRHAKDRGLWWPALYSGSHDETSLLAKVLRDVDLRGTSSRDPGSPISKFVSSEPAGKAHLFVVPYNSDIILVEATQRRDYFTAVPPAAGPGKCYQEEAKIQMDKLIQDHDQLDITALLTPSSTVESKRSTANRETPFDVAPRVWCSSSVGSTLRESPTSSSTGTEHEVPVTPREPIAGFRVTAQASSALAADGDDSEREQSGGGNRNACEMGTCVASGACSPQSGTKRSWAQTSDERQQEQHPQDRERADITGANIERALGKSPRRECFTDLANRRQSTNVSASSQFPRLDGLPTSSGLHFCGTQRQKQGLQDAGMGMVQCDARRGKVEGVAGSTEGSCGGYLQRKNSGDLGGVDNCRAGGPEQAGVETPAQHRMDTFRVGFVADEVVSTDRDAYTSPGKPSPSDDNAKEAALFREAGITGDEDFTELSSKLLKLGWKWGGQVGPLSSETWFLKPGATTKAAKAGVGGFKTTDLVVRYVQNILEVQGAITPDGEGGKVAMQTDGESAGESDSDAVREGGRVEKEQGACQPTNAQRGIGVTASTAGSCGSNLYQKSSEEYGGVGNRRAGGPMQAGVKTLPAQLSMDVCGVGLAADAVASADRDASTGSGEAAPADDIAKEAAQFRKAGITGDENFKFLSPKLKKLGWGWGGPVSPLSDNTWFLKAGAKQKTAQAGVGKFETGDDVVRYVRTVLEVRGATKPDGEDRQVARQSGSDSADESDCDSLDEGGRVEGEQGTCEPIEGEPLTREGQALQTALEALHPSKAPGVMKQRATEFERVLQFIVRSAKNPSGGSLYLCGCPGTGKTQTMAHVQAEVRRVAAKGAFPTPAFHGFNGTAFTDPNAMHTALWRAVTCGKAVPANIEKELSNKLTRRGKPTSTSPMLVVVLDEIDQLMSQNRQVLRKLFEWADAPKSRLVLVGIANSIEFDVGFHNLSKPPAKVLFQAYTPEDLMSILTERVGEVVQKPAVQLCSKKIAATHGDARRAISLCREAVVLARRDLQDKLDNAVSQEERGNVGQREGVGLVTIRHMSMALSAGRVSRYADAIAAMSIQAQIVLSVAAAAVREDQIDGPKAGKRARLTQGDLHEKCMSVWGRLRTGGGLSQIEFSWTIDMLEAQGLLELKGKQHAGGRARQLVLHVDFSDVETALGRHPFFKEAVSI